MVRRTGIGIGVREGKDKREKNGDRVWKEGREKGMVRRQGKRKGEKERN